VRLQFNPNTETLHKKPATENCNLDDSTSEFEITSIQFADLDQYSLCNYCFKAGETPFDEGNG
jgi:hypothetical protein